MLGCGLLAVLCGTCPIAQPWGRTAPQQLPGAGRASCARMAGALGASTVPVPLVAWPWWCPRCQHCPGDRSWAKLMIDPHVTPRPPVPLASPLWRARDRGWDWPHPNGVPPGLPGKLWPRGAVGGSLCGANPGHRAHLCQGDARCRTKECVGCCWGAGWSPADLGLWGHGQMGLRGLGDQRGCGDGGRDVAGVRGCRCRTWPDATAAITWQPLCARGVMEWHGSSPGSPPASPSR